MMDSEDDQAQSAVLDELTICAIQAKQNPEAFEALLHTVQPLIQILTSKVSHLHYDTKDDARQVLSIEVWNAVRSFDPSFGLSFGSFVRYFLEKRFKSWLRLKVYTEKSQFNYNQTRIESMENGGDAYGSHGESISERLSRRMFYREFEKAAIHILSRLELKVLVCWYWEMTYQEISELLGVSQKAVDNAMARAKKKFRGQEELKHEWYSQNFIS